MATTQNSRDELLNLFPDNNQQLIEAADIRQFVNAIYDEAVIKGEDVVDNLSTISTTLPLSANQGRILNITKEDLLGDPQYDGQVLASTAAGSRYWRDITTKLGSLEDVSLNNLTNGDRLVWDSSKQLWVNDGVHISTISERGGIAWQSYRSYRKGDVVTYDKHSLFIALTDLQSGVIPPDNPNVWYKLLDPSYLDDLLDVDLSDLRTGHYLYYDGTSGLFKNKSLREEIVNQLVQTIYEGPGIDVSQEVQGLKISLEAYLNDLLDVDVSAVVTGDTLVWSGTNWIASNILDNVDKGGSAWKNDQIYEGGDLVTDLGFIYSARLANIGKPPRSYPEYWKIVSLETLPHMDINDPDGGDIIQYDNMSEKWTKKKTTFYGGEEYRYNVVMLNEKGKLDSEMIEVTMFHRIDSWDPSWGDEYPDTTGHTPGAFWDIIFYDPTITEYTYTTGDLVGKTVKAGDFIIWGIGGWTIMPAAMNPLDYYRRDGTQPITANFEADGHKLVNVQDGTDLKDAVNFEQLQTKENNLGVPVQNDYILSSDVQGNRYWVENTGGLQEVYWTDIKGTEPLDNPELAEEFDKKANVIDVFDKTEHIDTFTGTPGEPIVTAADGRISPTLINVESLHYVGPFTPSSSLEYPDTTGETSGAFWVISGLALPYSWMTGDLAGQTGENGDYMIWSDTSGWSLLESTLDPNTYYALDGSKAITGPFAGGAQQIKNIANGTDNNDAITVFQFSQHTLDTNNPHGVTKDQIGLDNVENIAPEDMPISEDTQSAIDQKENFLGYPIADGMILSSQLDGTRVWVEKPDTAVWGNITGDINTQTDLVDELNTKINKSGDEVTGDLLVRGKLTAEDLFVVPHSASGGVDSIVTFDNTSGGNDCGILWSNIHRSFRADVMGVEYDLLHTGNVDPTDYLKKSGGIMTGALFLTGDDPIWDDEAAHKRYVDEKLGSVNPNDIMLKTVYDTNDNHIVDLSEDAQKLGGQEPDYYAKQADLDDKLSKTGDTYEGELVFDYNSKLTNKNGLTDLGQVDISDLVITPKVSEPERSKIIFTDTGFPNSSPAFYWNSLNHDFYIDTHSGGPYLLWHSGNFDPSGDPTTIRQTFYGDGTTKNFPISNTYTPWNANVYYNGVRLFEPDDVDISSGYEIVFTEAPETGDRIDFEGFKAHLLGDHPSG